MSRIEREIAEKLPEIGGWGLVHLPHLVPYFTISRAYGFRSFSSIATQCGGRGTTQFAAVLLREHAWVVCLPCRGEVARPHITSTSVKESRCRGGVL